jgi:hypothetical protein
MRISSLERRHFAYAETAPLEELTAYVDGERRLSLVLKVLSPQATLSAALGAKPDFVRDFAREIDAYRRLLDPETWGTALVYASHLDEQRHEGWILLERVDGTPLTEIGDFESWVAAARWARRFHNHFSARVEEAQDRAQHLLRYGPVYYRRWLERALAFTDTSNDPKHLRVLEHVALRHDTVVEELSQLPITLIHGEFYAANVLVQRTSNGIRVCPVDWEMAAAAPGVFDIAALSAGWDDARRRELAHAYQEAAGTTETGLDVLLRSIDLSSLQIALQWLGWSRTWSPPTEHRRDWLDHLSGAVERLAI